MICQSLREGLKPASIAYYFGEQGWLQTVTEKTFTQYIQAFRRLYPEQVGKNDDPLHLDSHVDPRSPHLSEEDYLEQLLRVQKIRVGIGLNFEKNTGIITKELHKDIKVAGDLVETLARMRGKMMGAGRPSSESLVAMPNEAKEQLRKNDQTEVQQTRLAGMFDKLGDLIAAARSKDNATQEE